MRVVKADDYQTWFIEEDNFSVLVDPWLDKKLNPDSSFFLQRDRKESCCLSEEELNKVKAVIITAPFVDHLHLPSIKKLGRDVLIFTTFRAKKILSKKGIQNKIICVKDRPIEIGPFKLSPYPSGFPYNWSSFCFYLENKQGKRLFQESHIADMNLLRRLNKACNVALITVESVKLFGILKLSMNLKKAIEVTALLGAKKLMATGTNPFLLEGLIRKILFIDSKQNDYFLENGPKILFKRGDEVIL
jgi:peroxiredoxin family protein